MFFSSEQKSIIYTNVLLFVCPQREQEEALEISGRHTQYHAQTFTITFYEETTRMTTVGREGRFHMAAMDGTDCRHPAAGAARLLSTESGTKVMERLTQRCGRARGRGMLLRRRRRQHPFGV